MIPFQMAQKPLPSSIPLHCNICAKKPTFSDVSHLLTHIASKGHLSTYYKLKVRAGSEDASRRLIESYDGWYAMWRIEDLMSERMNVKDQKRRPRTARLPALDGQFRPFAVHCSHRSRLTVIHQAFPYLPTPIFPYPHNSVVLLRTLSTQGSFSNPSRQSLCLEAQLHLQILLLISLNMATHSIHGTRT